MVGRLTFRALALTIGVALISPGNADRGGLRRESTSQKTDISGTWLFSVVTDAGTGTPTVTLKQSGDSLTGHYSSQLLGEADLTGSVKGDKFTFQLDASVQGTSVTVTYTGTVESKDALKGTVDLGGAASGTFTAKRQPPRP